LCCTSLIFFPDGESNEVQGLVVTSYPSLFLFPALDKSRPLLYKGAFEMEPIVDWSLERVSVKYSRELLLRDVNTRNKIKKKDESSTKKIMNDEL
jgi:hypothetical protein